jgi:2-polyprenyl-6-methoxyphenol hydroxylase-like FAD-dependent oxidoreductase
MGTTVKSLKELENGVLATFSNNKKEMFDIVIGSDGLNSEIRSYVSPKEKADYSGATFWTSWVKRRKHYPGHIVYQFGSGRLFTLFPSKSKKLSTVGFVVPSKHHGLNAEDTNKLLRENFRDMRGIVKDVLNDLPDNSEVYHHDDDEMHVEKWSRGRVVLMGDSIHALSPTLGMGASMALEDAYVLSQELAGNGYEKAFINYMKRRKPRIKFLAQKSKELHMLLEMKGIMCPFRNLLLRYVHPRFYSAVINKFLDEEI